MNYHFSPCSLQLSMGKFPVPTLDYPNTYKDARGKERFGLAANKTSWPVPTQTNIPETYLLGKKMQVAS